MERLGSRLIEGNSHVIQSWNQPSVLALQFALLPLEGLVDKALPTQLMHFYFF